MIAAFPSPKQYLIVSSVACTRSLSKSLTVWGSSMDAPTYPLTAAILFVVKSSEHPRAFLFWNVSFLTDLRKNEFNINNLCVLTSMRKFPVHIGHCKIIAFLSFPIQRNSSLNRKTLLEHK